MANLIKKIEFTHTLRKSSISREAYNAKELDLQVIAEVSYNGGPVHDERSYTVESIDSVVYEVENIRDVILFTEVIEEIETQALAEAMELVTKEREDAA